MSPSPTRPARGLGPLGLPRPQWILSLEHCQEHQGGGRGDPASQGGSAFPSGHPPSRSLLMLRGLLPGPHWVGPQPWPNRPPPWLWERFLPLNARGAHTVTSRAWSLSGPTWSFQPVEWAPVSVA